MPRIEIVGERRRAHPAGFRAAVLAEAAAPGARVEAVARRHGLSASLVYRWRRIAGADGGGGARLYPVRIADAPDAAQVPRHSRDPAASRVGTIEVELAGGVRVRFDETVGVAALRRVMTLLRG